MEKCDYTSLDELFKVNRRKFLKASGLTSAGLILGNPTVWAQDQEKKQAPKKPKTNIKDALKVPRVKQSLPGPFPGKVVEVHNEKVMSDDKPASEVVSKMFENGLTQLTGKNLKNSCDLFFTKDDIIGIKVNCVGAGLISTRPELVDVIVDWLVTSGIKRENLIIWDRFDYRFREAGFTPERYPGIGIEGIQSMDAKNVDRFIDKDGRHASEKNFDKDVYYWVDVEGPKDDKVYLNQHVFNGKYSYFGKLVTKKLTKIINVLVFKNTGNGISMATKNIGYAAVCNTNRLHRPLFFDVCTEVCAFPAIRDKMVLNITDGLKGQYNGGPSAAAQFIYNCNKLFFATDPFAVDFVCHNQIVEKRKQEGVSVNEHPRWTEYLRYAEKLGLGIADPQKINHIKV